MSRRNGVLYLDSRETPMCQHEKLNPSPTQRMFTYYGYKFENYCTGDGNAGVNTSVLGAGFHSICRGKVSAGVRTSVRSGPVLPSILQPASLSAWRGMAVGCLVG